MDRIALSRAVRRGSWAVAACQGISQLVSFGTLAVLYRLLSVDDFGAFAVPLLVINLVRVLTTLGLSVASVQDRNLTDEEQSHLFHYGLFVALRSGGVVITSACAVAWLAGEKAFVDNMIPLTVGLLISVLGVQHQARLERKLLLGRLGFCRVLAQLLGSVGAVIVALAGFPTWALSQQFLIEATSLTVLLWMAEPWRPAKRSAQAPSLTRFHTFGRYYTASSLLFWAAQNVDTLAVAILGGKNAVGLYSQAFNLMMRPVLLVTTPVTSVMLPTLSRAAAHPSEFRKLLVGFYRFVGLLLIPASVGMFLLADDIMLVLGGDKWQDAGMLLRALSPIIAVQGFINIAGSAFAAVGRADRLFAGSAAIALLLCQGIAAGWWLGTLFGPQELGGPLGVAIAYSAVTVAVIFLPYLWFCLTTVGVPLGEVLRVLLRPVLCTAAMGLAVWWAVNSTAGTPPAKLALGISVGVVVYAALMWRDLLTLLRQRAV